MSSTLIRGLQIRLGTMARTHFDASLEAQIAQIESNISTITNTMSTDTERLDAINAVTTAWQNADGTLQTTITNMVSATKTGAGLEADGTFVLPEGQNYLTGAVSIKQAIGLLDAALKSEESTRAAAVSGLQSQITALTSGTSGALSDAIAAEVTRANAADAVIASDLADEVTRATDAEAGLQTQIDNEVTARTLLNTTLSTSIAAEATARTTAVSTEATTRADADTVLQNNIDTEALARTTADGVHTAAISTEEAARIAADTAETTARTTADAALSTRTDALEANVAGNLTYSKFVVRETPTGAVNDVNALFTTAFLPAVGSESVFLNGMLQEEGAGNDYTINGKDVTFAVAPLTGDRVKVTYFR